MIYRLALIMEMVAIIICIHKIYNTKVKLDIETIVLFLLSLGNLEFVKYLQLNNIFTVCIYVFIVIYGIRKFKDTIIGSTISVLLMLIIITILQFLFVLPIAYFISDNQELRMLLTNILVSIFTFWILPKTKIHKLRMIFRKGDTFIVAIFCTILIIVFMIMIEGKVQSQIHLAFFFLAIPLLIVLLFALNKWNKEQEEKENIKSELSVTRNMQGKYDDLLTAVRLREHGFKNHLAALLSIKYTSKSYDELVKEQDSYFGKIREANKYNKLLFLGNSVVAGYLYEKFCEAETIGITVLYEIKGSFENNLVPIYHVVEMLGILIDNAVEAQLNLIGRKRLKFQFEEKEFCYCFEVLNPHPYMSYVEIESWFQNGNSKKGEGRGLGLYYIKKLCEENGVDISCRNVEDEKENWINFTLKLKKADKL